MITHEACKHEAEKANEGTVSQLSWANLYSGQELQCWQLNRVQLLMAPALLPTVQICPCHNGPVDTQALTVMVYGLVFDFPGVSSHQL